MTIISRNFQERPILPPECLLALVETTATELSAAPGAVGFAFVDDQLMASHHGRFKAQPVTTDVLAFPNDFARADPGTNALDETAYWGDIIICTDQATRQARELGHPYSFELQVLALHGVLHLLGFDHAADGGVMHVLEERLRPLCARSTACS